MAKPKRLLPIQLTPDVIARTPNELANAIIAESDTQVENKELKDDELKDEFRMACDGLSCWRMQLRFQEEIGAEELTEEAVNIFREMILAVVRKRGYGSDDFDSALMATMERARLPWGYTSLRLAYNRTMRNPIRLLQPGLQAAELPTTIAGIALELTAMQKKSEPILLPIDNLRALLNQRKLVVGGAVSRLMKAGILEQTSRRYSTGRAREFRFVAEEGKDFEFVKASSNGDQSTS